MKDIIYRQKLPEREAIFQRITSPLTAKAKIKIKAMYLEAQNFAHTTADVS
jgi:hypothetical protein